MPALKSFVQGQHLPVGIFIYNSTDFYDVELLTYLTSDPTVFFASYAGKNSIQVHFARARTRRLRQIPFVGLAVRSLIYKTKRTLISIIYNVVVISILVTWLGHQRTFIPFPNKSKPRFRCKMTRLDLEREEIHSTNVHVFDLSA